MSKTPQTELLCEDCWKQATFTWGTAALFNKRANDLAWKLRLLTFSGLVVPGLLGSAVAGFGLKWDALPGLLVAATIAGVVQFVVSVWSIAYSWPESLAYSVESAIDNKSMSQEFEELGRQADNPPPDLDQKVQLLKTRDRARQGIDGQKGVTKKEERYATRAGLYQFRRACGVCGKIPSSMKPTTCDNCGSF